MGAIIEAVSGKSYDEFLRDAIFIPLDLENSHYGGEQVIPKRVSGYANENGNYRNAAYVSITQPYAAGGLLSNVDDLAKWHAVLVRESLPGVSYEHMGRRFILNDGNAIDYG